MKIKRTIKENNTIRVLSLFDNRITYSRILRPAYGGEGIECPACAGPGKFALEWAKGSRFYSVHTPKYSRTFYRTHRSLRPVPPVPIRPAEPPSRFKPNDSMPF